MQGGLCEQRLGMPHDGHGISSRLPPTPPQGTAEPSSQDGSSSKKVYLGKGKKCCLSVKIEEKNVREITLQTPR